MDECISHMSPIEYRAGGYCGYCKNKKINRNGSASYWATSDREVHPVQYQGLVDRGWRRSGTSYYKPDLRHSCCPHYTIRLVASAFKPNRDQRQAVNRFTKHVLGQEYIEKAAKFCPKTREEKKRRRNHFDFRTAVHESKYENVKKPLDLKRGNFLEPAHRFEVNLESDTFTEEKYALFIHYQSTVHKDVASRSGFRSFLCSGLEQSTITEDGKERKIGSFHQCYRLDGRLVAIGVLDLMPNCVSSVYLIYHESVNEWNFGKMSALQEIALAVDGGYSHYYMGFYIHSCVKMRYKGQFSPTYILDPETYGWDLLDRSFLARLSSRDYVSLSRERSLGIATPNEGAEKHLENKERNANVPANNPSSLSLFHQNMPGVMSPEEVKELVNEQKVLLRLGDMEVNLGVLGGWDLEDMLDPLTVQGIAAEFVACIGPDLASQIVMDMRV